MRPAAADTIAPVDSPSYAFARRPKWIVGHLLAVVGIVVFVAAGLWQLSRLDERRALNAIIDARSTSQPAALPPATDVRPEAFEWQRVVATGEWVTEDELILQAQSFRGRSGHDVVTPLQLADGTLLLVDRGWVPIDSAGPPVVAAAPAAGTATVVGVLRRSQVRGSFGPTDPPTGPLDRVSRIDLDRLAPQYGETLYPMWLQLLEPGPAAPGGLPELRPLPEPGDGPHLSYAVQWFIFATIVAIGYPVLLRRTARRP